MNNKLNILLFFAFILILSLNYCIKSDEIIPFEETNYYECHNIESWDSLKIVNHLVGTWIWDSTKCPMLAIKKQEADNYKLVFLANSQLEVYKGNILEQEVTWHIQSGNDTYNIYATPQVDKVYGAVFFCQQNLVFYNSWLDGCDYYYTKIEE